MPELPEVITIRNDLRKELLKKRVTNIKKVANYNLDPSPKHFKDYVLNQTFEEITNVAKLILMKMSSGHYIATHLNMSGIILYNNIDPHIKITLELETGDKLHYSETRMFGYFEVWSQEKVAKYKSKHGKTALDESLTKEEFIKKIGNKRTPIKTVLLDQSLISGIGNIYANDSLYLSGINPKTRTFEVNKEKLGNLYENVRLVLEEGILHRGSTIDRYRDIYGKAGNHQNYFRIYGKKDKKCEICGTNIIFEKMQGRPTFYCPECQPSDNQIKLI